MDRRATVNGTITQFATDVPPIPDITWVQFSFGPGTEKVTVEKDTELTLDPGAYKDVKVKKGGTLILLAGRYVFKKFEMEKDSRLEFDLPNRPVVIDVADKLEFKDRVQTQIISATGDESDILFRVAKGKVELKKDGVYLGTFLAPKGDVKLHDNASLVGALYGRKVEVKKQAHIKGMPARDLFASLFVTP